MGEELELPVPRAPSRTAVMVAVARALHREEPPPWVIDDPLAEALGGPEAPAIRKRLLTELSSEALRSFSRHVCLRTRLPEDVLEEEMRRGVRQYVIFGAGLDSFAYRRGDLLDRVRVFEVDHPGSQAWKCRRLSELGIQVPAGAVFAPVDFEHQTLREGLVAAGFDFGSPAVVSWIGVTMYLTLEAIRSTLETVRSCAPGTVIVMTYNRPRTALSGPSADVASVLQAMAGDFGEPFLSMFLPEEAERLMLDAGYRDVVHFGPAEAVARYFPGRTDVDLYGAQRILVARVPA